MVCLVETIHKTDTGSDVVVESYDVTSLHTNALNNKAAEAVCDLLMEYSSEMNMYSFTIRQIMTLHKEAFELLCL